MLTYLTGSCHFSNLQYVCGDSFHALQSPGVSRAEMKIYERSMQALLLPAPRGFAAPSRVLTRLASLAQTGELARRLTHRGLREHPLLDATIWPIVLEWVFPSLDAVTGSHCPPSLIVKMAWARQRLSLF